MQPKLIAQGMEGNGQNQPNSALLLSFNLLLVLSIDQNQQETRGQRSPGDAVHSALARPLRHRTAWGKGR